MAHYQNLPVFKATYALLIYLYTISRNFQRDYRYTIGESLKKDILEMMLNLYRTNSKADKRELIGVCRENIEGIRIQVRILFDLKQLSLKQYSRISVDIESVSKQLVAWKQYEEKKQTGSIENKKENV